MLNYKNGLNTWLKGLNEPRKAEKAVEELRSGKTYWVVYYEYLGQSKSVAVRDLSLAVCISSRNGGHIHQYGGENKW